MANGKPAHIKTLEKFHATGPAREDHKVSIPVLEPGDVVAYVGDVVAVVYTSDREGVLRTYMHGFDDNDFENNQELLDTLTRIQKRRGAKISGIPMYVMPDEKTFVFQAELTERGIVG